MTSLLRVAVRTLCDFTAREGDLDLRFTPAPSAREGIAGHQAVTARRDAGYEREIALEGVQGRLRVVGRADGFDPARGRLEEIKTFRGDLDAQPERHRRLHLAQARVYGALLCRARGFDALEIALVYFDVDSGREQVVAERYSREALEAFFIAQCDAWADWAEREMAHRAARDRALRELRFAHADFRPGQRQLAESVYKAASTGRHLLLQAPTGIGKTIGTLFPMLKAMPARALDRVFFLTARNTGRALALEALSALGMAPAASEPAPALRSLELIARDSACEHPELACHGDACPLAAGFYDRLPQARRAAVERGFLDRAALREVALAHRLCPYYLGQEMAHWCDLVIADVNYWFDSSAMLYALSQQHQWRTALLVDEAHNLVARGRAMYSAELDRGELAHVQRNLPAALGAALKTPLERVARHWRALEREREHQQSGESSGYAVLTGIPAGLGRALAQLVGAVNELMVEQPIGIDSALLRLYFDVLHFSRMLEAAATAGETHYLYDITRYEAGRRGRTCSRLALRNVVPAPLLASRFEAAHAAVLFSATLAPAHFYRDQLGLDAHTPWYDLPAPFAAEQLDVYIAAHISTRYRDREASLDPIADLIAARYAGRPGNYLAFFSSFDYLERLQARLAERHPLVPCRAQRRRMSDSERRDFVAGFTPEGQGVALAVLGGVFGEGIDLPGERLVGAFIATLGLAQINPVNEQMRARMATLFGDGYRYAYLYPGITRVVQAAGRVIRTPADRGEIHLIDDRFARPEVRALLPGWWRLED
ncbi:ATP-dependent DNA helicase [Kushneria aurantia]|uniref:Helicase C-terminal domain-containing protein n=1 Tax=Kushneria aurantia TaxID=504092 RepID=A0ABV6G1R0_9GAMM|nr:ATP-dependent DNA helicase [Kushneria aurantia]